MINQIKLFNHDGPTVVSFGWCYCRDRGTSLSYLSVMPQKYASYSVQTTNVKTGPGFTGRQSSKSTATWESFHLIVMSANTAHNTYGAVYTDIRNRSSSFSRTDVAKHGSLSALEQLQRTNKPIGLRTKGKRSSKVPPLLYQNPEFLGGSTIDVAIINTDFLLAVNQYHGYASLGKPYKSRGHPSVHTSSSWPCRFLVGGGAFPLRLFFCPSSVSNRLSCAFCLVRKGTW